MMRAEKFLGNRIDDEIIYTFSSSLCTLEQVVGTAPTVKEMIERSFFTVCHYAECQGNKFSFNNENLESTFFEILPKQGTLKTSTWLLKD